MLMAKETEQERRYREETGREPPAIPEGPMKWQWDWEGTPEERRRLEAELGILSEEEEAPFVHPDQESLL